MQTITIDNWVKEHGMFLNVISEPTRMTYAFPNTIDNVQNLFANVLFKCPRAMSNRLFYAGISNFYVNSGRVISEDEKYEISSFRGNASNLSSKNSTIEIKNGVHLVSDWGGTNYWHWIISSLSRLCLLTDVPDDSIYIINSLNNKFVLDSLRVMGIDPKKCVEADKFQCAYCKKLFLPSPMGDFDKIGLLFLRNKIRERIIPEQNYPSRVYISRRKNRMVENETEVTDLLKKIGFVVIKCEDLSFEEQVKTFSNADVVIAPHGAGLTNLLFAKDNTKVLELRSPQYFGRCYYYLSNHLGFQYYSLYGEGKLPETKEEVAKSLYENMRINIPRLQQTLDLMGVTSSQKTS